MDKMRKIIRNKKGILWKQIIGLIIILVALFLIAKFWAFIVTWVKNTGLPGTEYLPDFSKPKI